MQQQITNDFPLDCMGCLLLPASIDQLRGLVALRIAGLTAKDRGQEGIRPFPYSWLKCSTVGPQWVPLKVFLGSSFAANIFIRMFFIIFFTSFEHIEF